MSVRPLQQHTHTHIYIYIHIYNISSADNKVSLLDCTADKYTLNQVMAADTTLSGTLNYVTYAHILSVDPPKITSFWSRYFRMLQRVNSRRFMQFTKAITHHMILSLSFLMNA